MKTMKKIIKFIFSFQFSKIFMLLETGLVSYLTYHSVQLAYLSIENCFTGSLPWIATVLSCAFAAYGVSASFYYNKSKAEQVAKIEKYGVESNSDSTPTI